MKRYVIYGGLLIVGILLGWLMFSGTGAEQTESERQSGEMESTAEEVWTCSMHPQVRQPEPGQCPICGMDLIPAESGEEEDAVRGVQLSSRAAKLAELQTTEVQNKAAERSVTLYGTIEENERKLTTQSSHIPGRIEQMFVHYEGERVERGQLIARIYSPELVTAQDELLEARQWKEEQPGLFRAAKEKLKRWKLDEDQIQNILEKGEVIDEFPIYAEQSGVVSDIMHQSGDYVNKGESLYKIADLSTVWAVFDAYESDLSEIEEGMKMEFRVRSLPNKTFRGTVDFVDPYIPTDKRAAKVRVIVPNPGHTLKPGMFATGQLQYQTGSDKSELVVPKSAVLWTGERSVVYVEDPSSDVPAYRLRRVELGKRLDEEYIILEGLYSGERVVTHGTFTVDAAAQLAGVRSMMMPFAEAPQQAIPTEDARVSLSEAGQKHLDQVIGAYLEIKNALVQDSLPPAIRAAQRLDRAFDQLGEQLKGQAKGMWMSQRESVGQGVKQIAASETLDEARQLFIEVSNQMIELVASYDRKNGILYVQHCPMANSNRGADWLSADQEIRNPYYGSEMLDCGKVVKEFE